MKSYETHELQVWSVVPVCVFKSLQSWSTARRCPSDSDTTFRMLSWLPQKLHRKNYFKFTLNHIINALRKRFSMFLPQIRASCESAYCWRIGLRFDTQQKLSSKGRKNSWKMQESARANTNRAASKKPPRIQQHPTHMRLEMLSQRSGSVPAL